MQRSLASAWRAAAADRGALPFVTRCGPDTRTELSGVAFTQWVSKCANYLADEYDEGIVLDVRLAPHWLWPVLAAAAMEIGGAVSLDGDGDVCISMHHVDAEELFLVNDHPFALPFREPLPAGARDFFLEVRAGGDFRPPVRPDPAHACWRAEGRAWTETACIDAFGADAGAERYLVRSTGTPVTDARTLSLLTVMPWVGGGSLVIADGDVDVVAERTTCTLTR